MKYLIYNKLNEAYTYTDDEKLVADLIRDGYRVELNKGWIDGENDSKAKKEEV